MVTLGMGSVSRIPNTSGGDDGRPLELYKLAVEEYRFQAQFNWTRTQYLLGLNVAILAAGAALAQWAGMATAPVFGLGIIAALFSGFAIRSQHDYYRAARERMRRAEQAAGVADDLRVDTTSTLGGRERLVSVTEVVYMLLGSMAVADTVGIAVVVAAR